MTVGIVRFETADRVESIGWLVRPTAPTDVAVVHVHGMSGNGFENLLIDALQSASIAEARAFFGFNNRGSGVVTWINRSDGTKFLGGACYEHFADSALDIDAAITAAERAGYSKIILQGHSLGCTKAVNYLTTQGDSRVKALILLAPTDMRGWGLRNEAMRVAAHRAKEMVGAGRGEELVGESCWDGSVLSARVFHEYTSAESSSDIYGTKAAQNLAIPTLVVYGTNDIGISEIDGDIGKWKERAADVFPRDAQFVIIDGASHSFRESLSELADAVNGFVRLHPPI